MKDDHARALRVHELLAARPEFRPVRLDEGRRFALWDLASLAEGALGTCLDPDSLTARDEKRLRLRLGTDGRSRPGEDEFRRRYWILPPDGRPGEVGTLALDTWPMAAGALGLSSLYVHPVTRRQGRATTALDTVYEACRAEGLHGFRLATHWTWQATVRYYLRRGLWLTSWKHDLGLARLSCLPRYEVRPTGDEMTLLVERGAGTADSSWMPYLVAGRHGPWLRLRETEEYRYFSDPRDLVGLYARSTLALHLAVRGWPLVRGEEQRARAAAWSCGIGEPEGLAHRIEHFEREARASGWRVDSPCTPDVPPRTLGGRPAPPGGVPASPDSSSAPHDDLSASWDVPSAPSEGASAPPGGRPGTRMRVVPPPVIGGMPVLPSQESP
ncbi:GNAT family N-acetyltransferase [Streptomyces sp. bgisy154]|uniref:GNAT family N-acetyltransferase n=1 Tax=Streptomyces sp. bgisy154 TaxID=3413794 RepID=UPI003D73D2A7